MSAPKRRVPAHEVIARARRAAGISPDDPRQFTCDLAGRLMHYGDDGRPRYVDPAHEPDHFAESIASVLSNSRSVTDRNVGLMLRASVHPDDGRIYPKRGTCAVGDEYAEHGRVRSQAIARTKRRAHALKLSDNPREFVPNDLTERVAKILLTTKEEPAP